MLLVKRCLLAIIAILVPQMVLAQEVTPEKVQAAISQLEKLVVTTMETSKVPGIAIAVVHRDNVLFLKGFGVREVGKDAQVNADTVFQLASVSKPLASTVLAGLVGEKLIGWDDKIINHDPGFVMFDPWVTREVTFRDMLCHRSGLSDHAGDLLEDLGYDRAEVLRRLRFMKPGSSFRSEYAYTNFGFSEAGYAGAKAMRKSWEDVADEKLFRPLGMKSSSYRFADFERAENRCHLHVRDNGKWVAKYVRMPDAQAPAGGASSSVRDMAQWLRLQLAGGKFEGKQIVAAEALSETHRPQIVNHTPANPAVDHAGSYGLGWNVSIRDVGRIYLGHSGSFSLGASTVVTLLPRESLGIVVLCNGQSIGIPESISTSFFDLVLKGKLEKDWLKLYEPLFKELLKPEYGNLVDYTKPPATVSPASASQAYLGTYRNDYYGDLEIVKNEKGLVLRIGPKKTAYEMRHWDRDTFTYQPLGENAAGLSGVTFVVGTNRRANQIIIENLDTTGMGAFQFVPSKK